MICVVMRIGSHSKKVYLRFVAIPLVLLKKKHQDLLDNNDEEISPLLEEKRKEFNIFQNVNYPVNRIVAIHFKTV